MLENDFFLIACREDFIESARLSIFETFCRIHQCISIRYVCVCNNVQYRDFSKISSGGVIKCNRTIEYNC